METVDVKEIRKKLEKDLDQIGRASCRERV